MTALSRNPFRHSCLIGVRLLACIARLYDRTCYRLAPGTFGAINRSVFVIDGVPVHVHRCGNDWDILFQPGTTSESDLC